MGKKSKTQKEAPAAESAGSSLPFLGGKASVDPSLASLFEQSAGPVKVPEVPRLGAAPKTKKPKLENDEDEEELSGPGDDSAAEDEPMEDTPQSPDAAPEDGPAVSEPPSRKRKRATGDDLEDSYMRRLAKEEQKEQKKRRAELPASPEAESEDDEKESVQSEEDESEEEEDVEVPKHEAMASEGGDDDEIAKSNRTIFLSNVSTKAITSKSAKKELMKHLSSFLSTLPESTGPHKIESVRFRSTAFASGGKIPKRAAFAKQEIHDDTTPSTNAYAVYSTAQAAKKAPAALNGTMILDRHLRVDNVAHPSKVDHKRCVFVGNLDFIDNEKGTEEGEKKKKNRAPADVEEGLWRTFNAHTKGTQSGPAGRGNVESVRVVRDRSTRVGKGFAYVQFYDQNCVEEALLLNDKRFPPMLPRKLRVVRAKKVTKKPSENQGASKGTDRTLQGRAGKLLGRSSEARLKAADRKSISQNSLVFEGNRATADGSSRIRVRGKSRGSKVKKDGRSKKRAAAYKAAGGKRSEIGK
ncbi:rRNA-processing protein NOP12 [Aspergillus mulundensis]|uniref:Nucleolar protein 12 n=1 Tax=Aspergillus mulundensis TaxID=1810919 RepID=A0A3D8S6C6_9EURO|nr:Nucleolar protein 12 [Aspergillus mulundensis]RDW81760.1 Nucleolar protein 12 [Aspergillus mulundensis]